MSDGAEPSGDYPNCGHTDDPRLRCDRFDKDGRPPRQATREASGAVRTRVTSSTNTIERGRCHSIPDSAAPIAVPT